MSKAESAKKVYVFVLTIIIVVITIFLISIFFSSSLVSPSNNSTNTSNSGTVAITNPDIQRQKNITQIKTVNGSPLVSNQFPYNYNNKITVDISSTEQPQVVIEPCVSNLSSLAPRQDLSKDQAIALLKSKFANDIAEALQKANISNNNSIDYSIDSKC